MVILRRKNCIMIKTPFFSSGFITDGWRTRTIWENTFTYSALPLFLFLKDNRRSLYILGRKLRQFMWPGPDSESKQIKSPWNKFSRDKDKLSYTGKWFCDDRSIEKRHRFLKPFLLTTATHVIMTSYPERCQNAVIKLGNSHQKKIEGVRRGKLI